MTSINIAEDLLLTDNVQSVTLTLMRTSPVVVTIDHAIGGSLAKDQDQVEGNAYAWMVPDVELNPSSNGREIRPDDVLNDGRHDYVVITATNNACRGKWDLTTARKR